MFVPQLEKRLYNESTLHPLQRKREAIKPVPNVVNVGGRETLGNKMRTYLFLPGSDSP